MFGEPHVERAFISYSLSMIPPWQAAVRESIDALAPGGELHVVDFGQQQGWPRWFERLMAGWLAKFSVYVQNVGDEEYYTGTQENFGASGIRLRPHPRIIGANVTFSFGGDR